MKLRRSTKPPREEEIGKQYVASLPYAVIESMSGPSELVLTFFIEMVDWVYEAVLEDTEVVLDRFIRDPDGIRGYFYLRVEDSTQYAVTTKQINTVRRALKDLNVQEITMDWRQEQ